MLSNGSVAAMAPASAPEDTFSIIRTLGMLSLLKNLSGHEIGVPMKASVGDVR